MNAEEKPSGRELARKASRELLKAQNDTTGGGKVSTILPTQLDIQNNF